VFAKNYDVPFVPVPLNHPMGGVLSGLVSFTTYSPITSERVSFPGDLGWPNSLFLLDRCYLIQRFITPNDKVLVVINTHNSAYDNGERRKQQLDLLKSAALKEYQNGNYVLIGGDWNLNPPDFDVTQFKNGDQASFNTVGSIKSNLLPVNWIWAYDENAPTNRQVDQPYKKGVTPTTILDYFLLSPNIELLEITTIDLKFEHSDHNPVKINIRLK
jgi:endonuclease/exonuclease/phosphatase family metal-dependent hydrolase